eukprot:3735214-Pleurochrysis_carterae.AAC.1
MRARGRSCARAQFSRRAFVASSTLFENFVEISASFSLHKTQASSETIQDAPRPNGGEGEGGVIQEQLGGVEVQRLIAQTRCFQKA